jgi:GNAT superfamily N-acetyltransferase
LVDIRITLENNLDNFRTFNWECFNINEASIIDLKYLRNIAKESHHDSRFYYDGHFNISKCSLFYQKWIENSIKSSDIVVFTARDIKIPIGYITCKITKGNIGQIGLFAVSDKYRGKGIGKSLINRSLQWFKDNKCNKAIVVTQGRNIIGQKVYQKCNFFTEDIKIWFHKWFTYEKI